MDCLSWKDVFSETIPSFFYFDILTIYIELANHTSNLVSNEMDKKIKRGIVLGGFGKVTLRAGADGHKVL